MFAFVYLDTKIIFYRSKIKWCLVTAPSPCSFDSVANNDDQCCGITDSEGGGVGGTVIKTSSTSPPSLGTGMPDTSVRSEARFG